MRRCPTVLPHPIDGDGQVSMAHRLGAAVTCGLCWSSQTLASTRNAGAHSNSAPQRRKDTTWPRVNAGSFRQPGTAGCCLSTTRSFGSPAAMRPDASSWNRPSLARAPRPRGGLWHRVAAAARGAPAARRGPDRARPRREGAGARPAESRARGCADRPRSRLLGLAAVSRLVVRPGAVVPDVPPPPQRGGKARHAVGDSTRPPARGSPAPARLHERPSAWHGRAGPMAAPFARGRSGGWQPRAAAHDRERR